MQIRLLIATMRLVASPSFPMQTLVDACRRRADDSKSRRVFLPCECSPKARPISASSSRPHAAIHGPACSTMQRRDRPLRRPISRCAGGKGNESDLSRNLSFGKMRCCLDELSACCGCKMRACVLPQAEHWVACSAWSSRWFMAAMSTFLW